MARWSQDACLVTDRRRTPTAESGARGPSGAGDILDRRYRALLGETAWNRLPSAIQRRFSRHRPNAAILYSGRVVETRLSRAGRVLAMFCHLIGAPLPDSDGATGVAAVSVIEARDHEGQLWSRTYERPGRFPQVIHSMKRFAGPTGLEEYVGCGIGMALRVSVEDGALLFVSDHYFLEIGRWRMRLPAALEPGRMQILHRDHGDYFTFELRLTHPMFGELLRQLAHFRDVADA